MHADIKIDIDSVDKRIDVFLTEQFPDTSRNQLQKQIKSGEIVVNDKIVKNGYRLEENDILSFKEVIVTQEDKIEIIPEKIALDIVYEDDQLIVINKSADMVVHPGAGNFTGTLVNALMHHCGAELSNAGGTERLGIVHRLDKGTSGLLVCAKTNKAHKFLAKQFEEKTAERVYKAFCWHTFGDLHGTVETQIGRSTKDRKKQAVLAADTGKVAITNYKVRQQFPFINVVHFKLATGRTHQIRVHANYLRHPIFADDLYSGDERQIKSIHLHYQKFAKGLLKYINRQALHAYKLSFTHPVTEERLSFQTDLPEDMQIVLEKLESKFQEYIEE